MAPQKDENFPGFSELCRTARELEKDLVSLPPHIVQGELGTAESGLIFPREFETYTFSYLISEAYKVGRKNFAARYKEAVSSEGRGAGVDQKMASDLHQFVSRDVQGISSSPTLSSGPKNAPQAPPPQSQAAGRFQMPSFSFGAKKAQSQPAPQRQEQQIPLPPPPPDDSDADRLPYEAEEFEKEKAPLSPEEEKEPPKDDAPPSPQATYARPFPIPAGKQVLIPEEEEEPLPIPDENERLIRNKEEPSEAEAEIPLPSDAAPLPPPEPEEQPLKPALIAKSRILPGLSKSKAEEGAFTGPQAQGGAPPKEAPSSIPSSSKLSPRLRAIIEQKLKRDEEAESRKKTAESEEPFEKAQDEAELLHREPEQEVMLSSRERLLRKLDGGRPKKKMVSQEFMESERALSDGEREAEGGRGAEGAECERAEKPALRQKKIPVPEPQEKTAEPPQAQMAVEEEARGEPQAKQGPPSGGRGGLLIKPIFSDSGQAELEPASKPSQEPVANEPLPSQPIEPLQDERMKRIQRIIDELSPGGGRAGEAKGASAPAKEALRTKILPAPKEEIAEGEPQEQYEPQEPKETAEEPTPMRKMARPLPPPSAGRVPFPSQKNEEEPDEEAPEEEETAEEARPSSTPRKNAPAPPKASAKSAAKPPSKPRKKPALKKAASKELPLPSSKKPLKKSSKQQPSPAPLPPVRSGLSSRLFSARPREPPGDEGKPAAKGAPERKTERPQEKYPAAAPAFSYPGKTPSGGKVLPSMGAKKTIPSLPTPPKAAAMQPNAASPPPSEPDDEKQIPPSRGRQPTRILPGGVAVPSTGYPGTYVPPARQRQLPTEQLKQPVPIRKSDGLKEGTEMQQPGEAEGGTQPTPQNRIFPSFISKGHSSGQKTGGMPAPREEEPELSQESEGKKLRPLQPPSKQEAMEKPEDEPGDLPPLPTKESGEEIPLPPSSTGPQNAPAKAAILPPPKPKSREVSGEATALDMMDDELRVPLPSQEEKPPEPAPSDYSEAKQQFKRKIEQEELKQEVKAESEEMLEQFAKENMIWLYEIYKMGGLTREDFLEKVREQSRGGSAAANQPAEEEPPNPALENLNRELDKKIKK